MYIQHVTDKSNLDWKKQKKLAVKGLFPESSPLIVEYTSLNPPCSLLVSQNNSKNRPPAHPTSLLQLRGHEKGKTEQRMVFLSICLLRVSFSPFHWVFKPTALRRGCNQSPRFTLFLLFGVDVLLQRHAEFLP